jgi:ABC-2 type transport system permease protein/capsular polysaccharide transport system permease protein
MTAMTVSTTTLRTSWAIQRRVIGALLMRETLTRFGRHNIGFLWLFAEPMIFTLGVTALWSAFRAFHGTSLPIVAFALTGYSSVLLWRNMPSRCIKAIEPNLALMYHRNVKIIDIFLARLILEAGGATISFVILSAVFVSIDWLQPPEDLVKVAIAWSLLAWFGFALSLLVGALSERADVVEKLWHPMGYLAFPLSGAAFMVDAFPPSVQQLLLLVPMVNGAEMLRDGYFGTHIRSHYDVGYLVMWCAALTLLGLAQLRIVGRKVTPE